MIFVESLKPLAVSYYTRLLMRFVLSMSLLGITNFAASQELLLSESVSNTPGIVIVMESYIFSPSEISIVAGEPITLILNNQSFLVPHNFLLDHPNGTRVLDVDISSGDSQTHTLTLKDPGTYAFYCDKQLLFFPTHREEGMEGRLIVQ